VEEAHHAAYCGLLEHHIPEQCINDIPDATNKSWALGNDRFKQRIEDQINRWIPKAMGGDRKSEQFKANRRIYLDRMD
jgi:putative transposase